MRKIFKRAGIVLAVVFLAANGIAAVQAWKFTHFSANGSKTESSNLTTYDKVMLLLTGISNPRPVNEWQPSGTYKTVIINSNVPLECWFIESNAQAKPKGTVALFHGYTGCKSKMLDRANALTDAGYNCLLVDFMGSGGSGGNVTTVGFKEAEEVKDCFQYLLQKGEQHIYLYGTSMGAAAIMKAINDYHLTPVATVVEAPFGTMYQTVSVRFRNLGVPPFPMAGVLLFWGGLENGFWGFGHNPVEYAKNISCPTLLQYGEKDALVTRPEIDSIYAHLTCRKQLITYPLAGHDNFGATYGEVWHQNVVRFLDQFQ